MGLKNMPNAVLEQVSGAAGIATWPTAAAYANGVSLAETMAYLQDSLRAPAGAYIPGYGYHIQKSHNLATDNVDLFNVTGMNMVTLMVGEVTTVVATTTTYQLRIKTDAVPLCAATTITTDADGTMYLVTGDPNVILGGTGAVPVIRMAFAVGAFPKYEFVIGNAGVASVIESDTSGAGTGVIVWHMWYLPLETSATIVAA